MGACQQVAVIGCGYVGLTTAAILAHAGYNVHAIEVEPKRLAIIQSGKSFFHEVGLDPLIASAMESGTLTATNSYDAIATSEIVFSCVGTPDNADGSSNLAYVYAAAEQAASLMPTSSVYVQKSTVPVGTGRQLIARYFNGKHIAYVSNPEFLSESTALVDMLAPARSVTGSDPPSAAERVQAVYRTIEKNAVRIADVAGISLPIKDTAANYIQTSLASAELIKVSANAFLATKISFANSIAQLADQAGADITEVMGAVGADPRIGRAFLNAGRGYGGGCFPKDVSGLITSARAYGVDLPILRAAKAVNQAMPEYCIQRGAQYFKRGFRDVEVAVLGLAFKPGTSDSRRSPAIAIANILAEQQAKVSVYDPAALEEAKANLHPDIRLADSLQTAVAQAECIFLTTDWPEFITQLPPLLAKRTQKVVLVDCMNRYPKDRLAANATYVGIGRD